MTGPTKGAVREWRRGMQMPFEDCDCQVNVEPTGDIPGEATLFLFPCGIHKEALTK